MKRKAFCTGSGKGQVGFGMRVGVCPSNEALKDIGYPCARVHSETSSLIFHSS